MIYAKYTIVLKTLLDDPESKALIDRALSTYPLYSPENEDKFMHVMTREEINKRILDHFKYREIGFETFGRWLDELEIAMNEIMPFYNQQFMSQDIINGLDDIFENLNVEVTYEAEGSEISNMTGSDGSELEESVTGTTSTDTSASDSSTSSTDMTTESKDVHSETPQSQLNITNKQIDSVTYADDVKWGKSDNSSESTSSGSSSMESSSESDSTRTAKADMSRSEDRTSSHTSSNTIHRKGNQGVNTYAHDMLEFRQLFINVVQNIIKDERIQELFMKVF